MIQRIRLSNLNAMHWHSPLLTFIQSNSLRSLQSSGAVYVPPMFMKIANTVPTVIGAAWILIIIADGLAIALDE